MVVELFSAAFFYEKDFSTMNLHILSKLAIQDSYRILQIAFLIFVNLTMLLYSVPLVAYLSDGLFYSSKSTNQQFSHVQ